MAMTLAIRETAAPHSSLAIVNIVNIHFVWVTRMPPKSHALDERDLQCLIKYALPMVEGVQVFSFSGPHLPLEQFRSNHIRYSLVITDYKMPGMDGTEFLTKIKKIDPSMERILINSFNVDDNIFAENKCVVRSAKADKSIWPDSGNRT
jgi:CheY-like chemotaxis protein